MIEARRREQADPSPEALLRHRVGAAAVRVDGDHLAVRDDEHREQRGDDESDGQRGGKCAGPAATRTSTIASGPYATELSASRDSAASPSRLVRRYSSPSPAGLLAAVRGGPVRTPSGTSRCRVVSTGSSCPESVWRVHLAASHQGRARRGAPEGRGRSALITPAGAGRTTPACPRAAPVRREARAPLPPVLHPGLSRLPRSGSPCRAR